MTRTVVILGFAGALLAAASVSELSQCWGFPPADIAWTELVTNGTTPGARQDHSLVYDTSRGVLVLFGGIDATGFQKNDVWALSLAERSWTQIVPAGSAPSTRSGHSAIYDPNGDRMIVFGGTHDWPYSLDDTWVLSFGESPAWSELLGSSDRPPPRLYHTAVYDEARHQMVVFGGWLKRIGDSGITVLNDTWTLSLDPNPAWNEIAVSGAMPGIRYAHCAAYDQNRDGMLVFGGSDGTVFRYSDTWALSLDDAQGWTQVVSSTEPPCARVFQAGIFDAQRNLLVIFGGVALCAPYRRDDTWALRLGSDPSWLELESAAGRPAARHGHAVADASGQMIMFGGQTESGLVSDAWALSLLRNAILEDSGRVTSVSELTDTPSSGVFLDPPMPNIITGSTLIRFGQRRDGPIRLSVYDVAGRRVATLMEGPTVAGVQAREWNGADSRGRPLDQGAYLLRLEGRGKALTQKILVLR